VLDFIDWHTECSWFGVQVNQLYGRTSVNLMKTVVAAAVALAAVSAGAAPILDNNMRPKPINNASGETDIQTVLNTNLGGVNKSTGQSAAGIWGSATGSPLSTVPTLLLEQSAGAAGQKFGIWFGTDTSSLFMYDLILGPATSSAPTNVSTLIIAGNTMFVTGFGCGTAINCTTMSGVTDMRISTGNFGFYFQSGNTFGYSLDMINNETRFMSYTDGATNWIFGFEDGGDNDFNDMVVKVESLNRVSAPGTLALLGLGLLGIGALRRRSAA
jgi:hypothetical protein